MVATALMLLKVTGTNGALLHQKQDGVLLKRMKWLLNLNSLEILLPSLAVKSNLRILVPLQHQTRKLEMDIVFVVEFAGDPCIDQVITMET